MNEQMTIDEITDSYKRLVLGGEVIRIGDPAKMGKALDWFNSFIFIREPSPVKSEPVPRAQGKKPRKKSETKKRFVDGGYMRRKDAAEYLGVSLRTLSEWQQQRVVPFIDVSHKVTLFRKNDLDSALQRFLVNTIGDKA